MITNFGVKLPETAKILKSERTWKTAYAFDPTTGILWWETTKEFSIYGTHYAIGWHQKSIYAKIQGKIYPLTDLYNKSVNP